MSHVAHHFFIPDEQLNSPKVILRGETGHHASRVLRLRIGEEITLADGRGGLFKGRVTAVRKGEVEADVLEPLASSEPPLSVTLLQGIPKGDKMELIIEKCTELGVKRIVAVLTERVITHLEDKTAARKKERWQKIARAAAQQSRRSYVPLVEGPIELASALTRLPGQTLLLVLWEEERSLGLKEVLSRVKPPAHVALLVGPEGGLSRTEVELARQAGGRVIGLGPRILRTETAGLVCLAALMYEWGDLGGGAGDGSTAGGTDQLGV
ncbi:MAG: 16S rRNA (uracil(1498)-N(3))-methyltransferase [Moorellaceae bacterium]